MFNPTDPDAIKTLSSGIIKVCESNSPKMALFLIPEPVASGDDVIDCYVKSYVSMDALSPDLRKQIRSELNLGKVGDTGQLDLPNV